MRLVLLLVLAALLPGCVSLDKLEIEQRLLAMERHAPVRALGVQRTVAPALLDGERVEAEFRWYRAGAIGPDRPTLLLIPGTPSSFATWSDVVFGSGSIDGLARDHDVIVLDIIGHGITSTTVEPYSFQRAADWIGAFLDTLDLHRVTIVGNSYGGEFAWRAALDHADRIERVVLMSSSGFARRDGEWLPEEVKMRELSLAKIGWWFNSRERILGALQPHFGAPVGDAHVEEVFLVCENRDNWESMIDLARDENGTRSAELAALPQPTLLLWGERDVAYPIERFARDFERTIPRARLERVPDSGHYPQEENPAFVANALRAFVKER